MNFFTKLILEKSVMPLMTHNDYVLIKSGINASYVRNKAEAPKGIEFSSQRCECTKFKFS